MIQDIIPPEQWIREKQLQETRRALLKLLSNFKTMGGIIGNTAILVIYNDAAPENTYVLTEKII